MDKRVKKAFEIGKSIDFQGKRLLLIGHGCIGSTFLVLLLRHSNIPHSNVLVVDKKSEALQKVPKTIQTKKVNIRKSNYKKEILSFLDKGDIIVDLAYYISTVDILKLCNSHGIHYINTAVETWIETLDLTDTDPRKQTLYDRQIKIQKEIKKFKNRTTAILTHGANPGWVSHFVKEALIDMVSYLVSHNQLSNAKINAIQTCLEHDDYPGIAKELDVQVIHISEKDSQVVSDPKDPNVFRNTWSPVGFVEEGTAPSELGWGTHESNDLGLHYKKGPQNQIALRSRGINTWVKTWVPSGPIIGMAVRHEEAYSISKYLTKDGYRPTVHYAYLPCPDAITSLSEIQNRIMIDNKIPDFKEEILNTTITQGKDELGVLLFSKKLTWWRGSLLDIVEARKLIKTQSATSVQVGISVLAAVMYMIMNPEEGVIHPEKMKHLDILWLIEAYLGPIKSIPVNWSPLDSQATYQKLDKRNPFRFENFVVSYYN
jgi:homospermidine synthase